MPNGHILLPFCHSEASPKGVAEESQCGNSVALLIDSGHAGSITIARQRHLIRTVVVANVRSVNGGREIEILRPRAPRLLQNDKREHAVAPDDYSAMPNNHIGERCNSSRIEYIFWRASAT